MYFHVDVILIFEITKFREMVRIHGNLEPYGSRAFTLNIVGVSTLKSGQDQPDRWRHPDNAIDCSDNAVNMF